MHSFVTTQRAKTRPQSWTLSECLLAQALNFIAASHFAAMIQNHVAKQILQILAMAATVSGRHSRHEQLQKRKGFYSTLKVLSFILNNIA